MQFFSTSCAKITCAPTPFLCITVNTTAASPSRYTFGQYSDSTCKHTACIEAAFLPVNEGYRFLILCTSLLVTLYSTRSHHASSPSRRFPALTLPSRTPLRPLSPRLFSSQLSIRAVELLSATPLRSLFLHVSRHPSCPSCASPWDCEGHKRAGLSRRVSAMSESVEALRSARRE